MHDLDPVFGAYSRHATHAHLITYSLAHPLTHRPPPTPQTPAMHDLDPVFRAYSRSDKMAAALRALGFRRPLPVQSMYIYKQPHIGGEVVPHQASCLFLYVYNIYTGSAAGV